MPPTRRGNPTSSPCPARRRSTRRAERLPERAVAWSVKCNRSRWLVVRKRCSPTDCNTARSRWLSDAASASSRVGPRPRLRPRARPGTRPLTMEPRKLQGLQHSRQQIWPKSGPTGRTRDRSTRRPAVRAVVDDVDRCCPRRSCRIPHAATTRRAVRRHWTVDQGRKASFDFR